MPGTAALPLAPAGGPPAGAAPADGGRFPALVPGRGAARRGGGRRIASPVLGSLGVHGSAGLLLAALLVGNGARPPLERLAVDMEIPVVVEEFPPEPPPLDLPEAPPPPEPEGLEEAPEEEVDPRAFEEPAPVAGIAAEGSASTLGIGGGGIRVRPRRARPAPAAIPGEAGAGAAVAPPAPRGPSRAARLLADLCEEPDYPARLRRLGVEGAVELVLRIGADGAVREVEVLLSSGHAAFDAAALEAVRRWRFEPALADGEAVEDSLPLRVLFRLRGVESASERR